MSEFKKGEVYTVQIEKLNEFGVGIADKDGVVLEIPKTLPGETVEAELERDFNNGRNFFCRLKQIIKPSDKRIQSPCPDSMHCLGCSYDFMEYSLQLEFKTNQLKELFPEISPLKSADKPFHYRNNAKFLIGRDEKQEYYPGVLSKNRTEIIKLENCLIYPELFYKISHTLIAQVKELNIPVFNAADNTGVLKGFAFRYSFDENTVILSLITRNRELPEQTELVNRLRTAHPEIEAVFKYIEDYNAKRFQHVAGEKFLVETLIRTGLKLKISVSGMLYPNFPVLEQLYEFLSSSLKLSGREKVLDINAGIGLNSIFLAKQSKLVYALEENRNSIKDCVFNARLNKVENTLFINKPQHEVNKLDDILKDKIDVLFASLTRDGMREQVYEIIPKKQFEKIVLVSSHPVSLKNETEKLKALGYAITALQPFDSMPQTYFTETVAVLEKKKKIVIRKPVK